MCPRRSTSFHRMMTHKQPHPEEHRVAMRLEGWATTLVYPTLRDGPAGLLRVRLVPYQHSMKASTRSKVGVMIDDTALSVPDRDQQDKSLRAHPPRSPAPPDDRFTPPHTATLS